MTKKRWQKRGGKMAKKEIQNTGGKKRVAKKGWQKRGGKKGVAKKGWQKRAGKKELAKKGWQKRGVTRNPAYSKVGLQHPHE